MPNVRVLDIRYHTLGMLLTLTSSHPIGNDLVKCQFDDVILMFGERLVGILVFLSKPQDPPSSLMTGGEVMVSYSQAPLYTGTEVSYSFVYSGMNYNDLPTSTLL
jgi:hypothetical protein